MAHLLASIYETFIHIHIHYLRTVFHLCAGYCHGFVVLFRRYKSQKFLTSCHIASLAHVHKVEFGGDAQRLQSGEGHHGLYLGHLARRVVLCHLGYGGYMRGRSAAATAYHVHQSCLEHGLHMRHHSGGCLIIFAHLVGQSGIGIHAHCHRRYGRKFFHPTAHTFGAKSAIQTNHQRSSMLHTRQGCCHGLSAEHSPALGERERYGTLHNALIFCLILLLGCKHGFKVQCVETGLKKQEIHSAVHQSAYLVLHRHTHFRPIGTSRCGIVNIGRNRQTAVRRTDAACHPTLHTGMLCHPLIGSATSQLGSGASKRIAMLLKPIIGKRNGIRIKAIGLYHIGTCIEVGTMYARYHVGTRQRQNVVASTHRHALAPQRLIAKILFSETRTLNHRAKAPIEHQYPPRQRFTQSGYSLISLTFFHRLFILDVQK